MILLVFGYLCFTRYSVATQYSVGVVCMPMSSKFLTESTVENIVKIGQYLAKMWTKYDSLLFWATLYSVSRSANA